MNGIEVAGLCRQTHTLMTVTTSAIILAVGAAPETYSRSHSRSCSSMARRGQDGDGDRDGSIWSRRASIFERPEE